jgi:hypothetical protein
MPGQVINFSEARLRLTSTGGRPVPKSPPRHLTKTVLRIDERRLAVRFLSDYRINAPNDGSPGGSVA